MMRAGEMRKAIMETMCARRKFLSVADISSRFAKKREKVSNIGPPDSANSVAVRVVWCCLSSLERLGLGVPVGSASFEPAVEVASAFFLAGGMEERARR